MGIAYITANMGFSLEHHKLSRIHMQGMDTVLLDEDVFTPADTPVFNA
jgi:hypothetical protein